MLRLQAFGAKKELSLRKTCNEKWSGRTRVIMVQVQQSSIGNIACIKNKFYIFYIYIYILDYIYNI